MPLDADRLRAALGELPPVGDDALAAGPPVAARLRAFIEEHRAGSTIIDLYDAGPWVHFVLAAGEPRYWEIDCLSPNDFRLYPGFERKDHIAWANVWVRGSNLTVDEMVDQVNDVAFRKDENA